ncbi:family 43 glycosylhydrolase [Marinoscillum sp.]|uniref:family 43 glycosylhydrolase n=1 Tax=Marinoscillum sp. TaxID=2024838 RepID=UPI003BA85338
MICKLNITLLILILLLCSNTLFGTDLYFETEIHDPSTIKLDDGTYWTFGTGDGIATRFSNDLVSWRIGNPVFPVGTWPDWINQSVRNFEGHFWAPDVIEMNGKYYLYYSAAAFVENAEGESAIGVAVSNSLTNPDWQDLGMVVSSQTEPRTPTDWMINCIDPGLFKDEIGNVWMVYGSHYGGIYSIQIDTLTGKRKNDLRFPIVGNNGNWNEYEAAQISYHNGFYYAFVNLGECCAGNESTYYIVTGRSTSPTGPFLDRDNKSLWNYGGTNILDTDGRYIGPGHYGYYNHNGQDLVSIHYYDGNTATGWPSRLDILEMSFVDGWPVLTRDFTINGSSVPAPVTANLVDGDTFNIVPRHSGKALAIQRTNGAECGIPENGSNVNQWSAGDVCEQWIFRKVDDYFWSIHPVNNPSLGMDVNAFSQENGANVQLWDYWGGSTQQYRLIDQGGGYYQIMARHSGKMLDVFEISEADGANVVQWESNGSYGQQYSFVNTAGTNIDPTVSIADPADNSSYPAGSEITISVTAADPDGVVAEVKLYVNDEMIGSMSTSPYEWVWTVPAASSAIRAVATDNNGGSAESATITVLGELPLSEFRTYFENDIHDPAAIQQEGDTYWTFGTGHGVASKYSSDLVSWEIGDPVFSAGTWPAWINSEVPGFEGHFWAPDAIFMEGYYYLYYSASTFGSSRSAIGVARTRSLNNPDWEDLGLVVDSNGGATEKNAIDPALFRDDDGRVYMSYGSFFGGIGLLEIDPSTGKPISSNALPLYGGGHQDIEAPYIIKEGIYYYLFVNRGKCCQGNQSTYSIEVGRSLNIAGPYLNWRTVLGSQGEYIGPGHYGYFNNNGQELVSIHYYDGTTADGWPSRLNLLEMTFVDGWPHLTRDFHIAGSYPPTPVTANLQDGDTMRIIARHSGKFLSLEKSQSDGSCQADFASNVTQGSSRDVCEEWVFRKADDHYWSIHPASNTFFGMDVFAFSQEDGANVSLWEYFGGAAQQFRVIEADSGYYQIVARHSSKVIEVLGMAQEDGANVGQWKRNASNAQQFTFMSPEIENIAPFVQLVNPLDSGVFLENTMVSLEAEARDMDGDIVEVAFFVDGIFIGKDQTAPYRITYLTKRGTQMVFATTLDNDGATAQSETVRITGKATLNVDSLKTYKEQVVRGYKRGVARVWIADGAGDPISGATVSGSFFGTFNESYSGVTGSDGQVTFKTANTSRGYAEVGFCVEQVAHEMGIYDQSQAQTCYSQKGSSRIADEQVTYAPVRTINIFPNPVTDYAFVIDLDDTMDSGVWMTLVDMGGRQVFGQELANVHSEIMLPLHLKKGIYVLTLQSGSTQITRKIVIR